MEVLFKSNAKYYYIENGIQIGFMCYPTDIDFDNIKHIKDMEILFHYRDIKNNTSFPVYFEHDSEFVTMIENESYVKFVTNNLTKDYTLTNLNLL